MRTCEAVTIKESGCEAQGWTSSFSFGATVYCVVKLHIPYNAPRSSYSATMRWYAPSGELRREHKFDDLKRKWGGNRLSLCDSIDSADRAGSWRVVFAVAHGPTRTIVFTVAPAPPPPPNKPPVAKFEWSPSVPAPGTQVTFTVARDRSLSYDPDGVIVSYTLNFGDGTTKTIHPPQTQITHVFPAGWVYTVTLTVTDNDGATATYAQPIPIPPEEQNQRPIAAFSFTPLNPNPGDAVTFDAAGSYDPDGYIRTYYWDFDSNGIVDKTETQPTTSHRFTGCGAKRVTLRVVDDKGASVVKTETIHVNCPSRAQFSWTPLVPQLQDEVQFDARSSSDPDGQIVSYVWDFGDGSPTESGAQVTHAYAEAKRYTVTLTVTDDKGLSGEARHTVRVNAPPVAAFEYSPAVPNPGTAVTLTLVRERSLSYDPDGVIVSYTLDFGDGTNPVTIRPPQRQLTHSFSAGGSYPVTITVTDNDGASATYSQQITVNQRPVALFNFTPAQPNPGDEVSFDASGSYDPDGALVSYAWNFGDNTSATGMGVTHHYAVPGRYNVRLTVRDNADAIGILTKSIDVKDTISPTSVATLPPLACGHDWYGAPVSVDIAASDNGAVSAISYRLDAGSATVVPGPTAKVRINTEGAHTLEYWATDTAGNVESPHNQVNVSIDLRGPSVNIRVPSQGAAFYLNQPITPDVLVSDAVSGVLNKTVPESVDTSTVGKHTFVGEATDLACHRTSLTHSYYIHYKVKITSPIPEELIWTKLPSTGLVRQPIPVDLQIPMGSALPLRVAILDFYDSPVTPTALPSVQVMRVGPAETYKVISSVGGVLALNQESMQYEMTLPTYNLARGTYELWIATGDAGIHRIRFQIR